MTKRFLIFILVFGLAPIADADLLWLTNAEAPVSGILVNKDKSGVITWMMYDGDSRMLHETTFDADETDGTIQTIDSGGLAKLTVSDLAPWRDHAEQLSSFKQDIFAQHTARKMFLVCIYHGSKNNNAQSIVDSAIRNLIFMSDSNKEKMQFLKLGMLYSDSFSQPGTEFNLTRNGSVEKSRTIALLRLLRQERYDDAQVLSNSIEPKALEQWLTATLISEFRTVLSQRRLSPQLRVELLNAEFRLRYENQNEEPKFDSSHSPLALSRRATGESRYPRVEELSSFDLEATEFRNGQWQRTTTK